MEKSTNEWYTGIVYVGQSVVLLSCECTLQSAIKYAIGTIKHYKVLRSCYIALWSACTALQR